MPWEKLTTKVGKRYEKLMIKGRGWLFRYDGHEMPLWEGDIWVESWL